VRERLADNTWVMLAAMGTQTRSMRGSPIAVILGVVQPVVFLIVATAAGEALPARASTQLVIGVGLTALWGSTIWSAGGILRGERASGTLARAVTGYRSPSVVFLGKCLGATVRITAFVTISTIGAAALLGVPLRARHPGWMLVGFVVVVLSGTALGMLLSCLFLVTRHAAAWSALLMYPVFIISGMMIPQYLIPVELRWPSTLISLRWAAEFLAAAASGAPAWPALAMVAALTCLYFATALATFRWLLRRARQEGTLDHV
jgi:ABC-2 type transport system permease protein